MLLRATCTFHAPGNITIEEGALFDSSDPLTVGRAALFEPADAAHETQTTAPAEPPLERATARPGTKSTAKRAPAKRAQRKPKA